MPLIDVASRQNCSVEDECLFLPSDFDHRDRQVFELVSIAASEARLREGQAFDALSNIQTHVKAISAMWLRKQKDDRGITSHTRTLGNIREAES